MSPGPAACDGLQDKARGSRGQGEQQPSFPPKLPRRMVFKNIVQETNQCPCGVWSHSSEDSPTTTQDSVFEPKQGSTCPLDWTESDHLKEKLQTENSNTGTTTSDTICLKTGRKLLAKMSINYGKNQAVCTIATSHTWPFKLKLIKIK